MYVIVGQQNEVIEISETIGYQENGNVLVHDGSLAIAKQLVKEVVELETVPDEVIASPGKYLYQDGEFVVNPNWTDPLLVGPASKQDVLDLMTAITDLYELLGVQQ